MAWRPSEWVTDGEIDNTTLGWSVGWIKIQGRDDREFLFGVPMVAAIADQVLEIKSNGRFAEALKNEPDARDPFYSLTIEVHRDWLMTPREDLDGLYPRQMLHGGIDWIDSLAWGQRLRFEQGKGG